MPDLLHSLSVWLLPVLTAITLHEAAHGWMAEKLGDDTARRLGRVTFNPIAHIDPFGTLILPGLLILFGAPFIFGWAKPVPVAFHRLRRPKRDMIWVALAGPLTNIALAVLCGLAFHGVDWLPAAGAGWVADNLANAMAINVVLATFNMLPIPPLDGGRVVTGLLPYPWSWRFARLERYGLLLVIGLLVIVPLVARELGYPFNPLAWILWPAISVVYDVVLFVTGWPAG
jgi:Zn-dependent protease